MQTPSSQLVVYRERVREVARFQLRLLPSIIYTFLRLRDPVRPLKETTTLFIKSRAQSRLQIYLYYICMNMQRHIAHTRDLFIPVTPNHHTVCCWKSSGQSVLLSETSLCIYALIYILTCCFTQNENKSFSLFTCVCVQPSEIIQFCCFFFSLNWRNFVWACVRYFSLVAYILIIGKQWWQVENTFLLCFYFCWSICFGNFLFFYRWLICLSLIFFSYLEV